jgi:hypothetical protein
MQYSAVVSRVKSNPVLEKTLMHKSRNYSIAAASIYLNTPGTG